MSTEIPKCCSCGKPLKRFSYFVNIEATPKLGELYRGQPVLEVQPQRSLSGAMADYAYVWTGKYGYGGSGHFCTLRCGYSLGEAAARNGIRLATKGKATCDRQSK